MNRKRHLGKLAKLLRTMLRHAPETHGLVPDGAGYVSLKDVLKALHELDGCRGIRRADIDELLYAFPEPGLEMEGGRIRATGPRPAPSPPEELPPKLLYAAVRRKAHRTVHEKGLERAGDAPPIVLAADPGMAERLGRRKDAEPVLVTVNVRLAAEAGVELTPAGAGLFTADRLPRGCLILPALPKEKEAPEPSAPPAAEPPAPGSVFPEPQSWADPKPTVPKRYLRRKDPEWKQERRRRSRRS